MGVRRRTVPVVVVHLRQHVHRVRVKYEVGRVDDPEGVELVSEHAFPKDELRCVSPVQAVDTVGSADAILESDRITVRRARPPLVERIRSCSGHSPIVLQLVRVRLWTGVKETCKLDGFLRDVFEVADDVLRLPI